MCGRFALVSDLPKVKKQFEIQEIAAGIKSDWNISPGQYIPVILHRDGQNILGSFLWGLIPAGTKDPSLGSKLINARAETLSEKPSFRNAFKKRRCLIIADGFYEWKLAGKKRVPFYFYLPSREPFGLAGLYETWLSPEEKQVNTCLIITTEANQLIKPIHDRMPVIVPQDQEQTWLRDEIMDSTALIEILKPYPAEKMDYKTGMGPKFAENLSLTPEQDSQIKQIVDSK
jgi:putative SOS response-associated peptidase YedK